jgi:hypothetical protein
MGTWRLSIVASRPSIPVVYAHKGIKPNQTESNRIKPNQSESNQIKPFFKRMQE